MAATGVCSMSHVGPLKPSPNLRQDTEILVCAFYFSSRSRLPRVPRRALAVHERHHRDTSTSMRTSALNGATPSYTHSRGSRSSCSTQSRGSTGDSRRITLYQCALRGIMNRGTAPHTNHDLQVERYKGLDVPRDLLTTMSCVNAIGTDCVTQL